MTALATSLGLGPFRSWLAVAMLVAIVLLMALVITELQHEWHARRERERAERRAEMWARQSLGGHATWQPEDRKVR